MHKKGSKAWAIQLMLEGHKVKITEDFWYKAIGFDGMRFYAIYQDDTNSVKTLEDWNINFERKEGWELINGNKNNT